MSAIWAFAFGWTPAFFQVCVLVMLAILLVVLIVKIVAAILAAIPFL